MFDSMTKSVTLRCRDGLPFKGYRTLEAPQARGRACKRAFDQGHFLFVSREDRRDIHEVKHSPLTVEFHAYLPVWPACLVLSYWAEGK